MVVPLKSAAATGGADMDPPPGAKDYAAHLSCATADCASATVVLTKHLPPLQGQAVIHVDHRAAASHSIETSGTPKDLQAKIASALQSGQMLVMSTSIVRIDGGPTFFGVEARIPPGATVPGHPADGGRIMRFSGQLGDPVTITMSYVDTQDDLAAGSRQDFEGSASYSDSDQSVRLGFAGSDRIKTLAFGNFRI
jgi:hypothetical protein